MQRLKRLSIYLVLISLVAVSAGCSTVWRQKAILGRYEKATLDFPLFHPAHGLKKGEYTIKNGVIIEHLPDGSRKQTLIAGVPLDQQPDFDISPDTLKRLSPKERYNRSMQLVRWAANYDGQYLPKNKQSALLQLYEKKFEHEMDLKKRARAKSLKQESVLRLRSEQLADFILKRRQIFEGHTKAQIHLYGRPFDRPTARIDKARLVDAVYDFLSGRYLREKRKQHRKSKRLYQHTPLSQRPKRADLPPTREEPTDFPSTGEEPTGCEPGHIPGETRRVYSTKPVEVVGYSAKIFRTEDTAVIGDIPGPLDDILDSENIVHTSLATSIWRTTKHEKTEKIYNGSTLLRSKTWDVYISDRVQWGLVNGCSGTYEDEDVFVPIAASTHETLDDAKKYIYQYQPPHRIRAGAYPAGCFGTDWICHQVCNSFAQRKWNIIPVRYAVSSDLFGDYGDRGISPDFDSCGEEHPGCVPGAGCYYNSRFAHNSCPPGCGLGENPLNTGEGWDLQLAWDHVEAAWIDSGVRFTSRDIPDTWNERGGHFETEYCPGPPELQICNRSSDCDDQWVCIDTPDGWEECPTAGATNCVCVPDEVAQADQYPPPGDTTSDIDLYLGKPCDDHSDCGQTLWCLNHPTKPPASGRCGYFPEVCSNHWMCPIDTLCGTFTGTITDMRFSTCTPQQAAAGECRCEYPTGPPR